MVSNIVNNFAREINDLASRNEPFFFIVDFELKKPLVYRLGALPDTILYSTPLCSNVLEKRKAIDKHSLKSTPIEFDHYASAFRNVISNIAHGNSYLLNLTFATPIEIDLSLEEIFSSSKSKYRLLVKDDFVVFSPETFIRIEDDTIKSFPMKGTIDASIPKAMEKILKDEKELSEHNTIVDLIRNDLSIVASEVKVTRYRYNDRIKAGETELIQISSEITGKLTNDWKENLGDILISLLPAGSVSGAPKKETLRIIRESESGERGYYTGVFGIFDGKSVDSAVLIRYIEQIDGKYVYRSGGGITYLSDLKKEYEELIAKVYVPID